MKRLAAVLAFCLFVVPAAASTCVRHDVTVDGRARYYMLCDPDPTACDRGDVDNRLPLLFAFHGAGGSGESEAAGRDYHDDDTRIVVYPDAYTDEDVWELDDLSFMQFIYSTIECRVDSRYVHCAGTSAGGYFCSSVGCHQPLVGAAGESLVAGILVTSAGLEESTSTCTPASPINAYYLCGEDDTTVPCETEGGLPPTLPAVTYFRTSQNCGAPSTVNHPDGVTTCEVSACDGGTTVEFCRVLNSDHFWFDIASWGTLAARFAYHLGLSR